MKDVKVMQDVKTPRDVALTALTVALLLTAAACGGKPTPDAAQTQTPQQAAQNAAQAMQQAAQGMQQAGQHQTATAVDFEKLIALLPEHAGWTRSAPKGEQVSMGIAISRAEASYEKGDGSINLQITDTSFSQLILAPMSMYLMSTYSERSSDGYKKAAALGGSPGYETWDNNNKEAEVTVVVANRFLVTAKGRGVDNADVVRSLVQGVDQAKLAALK